jgi:hypothetical protein
MRQEDKIIIGASSVKQLIENMEIIKQEKDTIHHLTTINYLNSLYAPIKDYSPNYYY